MKQIKLTQGKVALVSNKDFRFLSQHQWYAYRNKKMWYAVRNLSPINGVRRQQKMHRAILGVDDPKIQVDHKDHNGLNNQRSNIRICNGSQNLGNRLKSLSMGSTSVYKGVSTKSYYTGAIRWISQIMGDGKKIHLGCFKTEVEAAIAYNEGAKKYHGKFASLNIII